MTTESVEIRWKQRFENLDKAYKRLLQARDAFSKNDLEIDLLRISLIGAFEQVYQEFAGRL